jgi:hypothetical protein
MLYLLYLARPKYGGWVTFTTQLAKINDIHITKITKRGEKKKRDFGYGVKYINRPLSQLQKLEKNDRLIITAIDKTYHYILDNIDLSKTSIVIHDPTEIKSNKKFLLDYLPQMKVITIRKNVQTYLNNLGIINQYIPHPYLVTNERRLVNQIPQHRNGIVGISRIDWDKHTDIILQANQILDNPIELWGDKNDRYVYQKLKLLDSMKKEDTSSCYRGRFGLDTESLQNILKTKEYMIDLSRIQHDGGGTQYTFLEAIHNGCILILNRAWVDTPDSIWQDGVNCLAVSNSNELVQLVHTLQHKSLQHIQCKAEDILNYHSNNSIIIQWKF